MLFGTKTMGFPYFGAENSIFWLRSGVRCGPSELQHVGKIHEHLKKARAAVFPP